MSSELPSNERVEKEKGEWRNDLPVQQRIKELILTQDNREALTAGEVADRAGCSTGTARKYLKQMSGEEVIEIESGNSKKYIVNQEFLRWREAFRIASNNEVSEIQDKIDNAKEDIENLLEKYSAVSPDDIRISEIDSGQEIHTAISDKAYLSSSQRYLEILKDALDMAIRMESSTEYPIKM